MAAAADYFKPKFEKLIKDFSNITKEIHLIPNNLKSDDLLNHCKVQHDKRLIFTDPALNENPSLEESDLVTGGLTIGFSHNKANKSAIFINESILGEPETDINWVWRYNALYHELMHALDIMKQKNFNLSKMTVDLVAAEAFADIKTLKHLESDQHHYMGFALKQYAENILSNRSRSPFREKIFDRITKSISFKKIELWTSEEFLESLHAKCK